MFGLFKKDKKKKLEKAYADLLTKATNAQRNGDMALFAKLSSDADKVLKEIDSIDSKLD